MSNVFISRGENSSVELPTITNSRGEAIRGSCWMFNVSSQFPLMDVNQESGEATLSCCPPHEGYLIHTVLINGKPSGESRILNTEDIRVASLVFVDGIASGTCKLYDDDGKLFFEGNFVNGYREGEGKEFDASGHISYEGLFKEGKRMNMSKVEGMEGFWKEVNEKGEMISICQKNDKSENNGVCYFYSNGNIDKVSEWKNGVEVSVLKRFEGKIMVEFENGVKRYEGEYKDSVMDGYPREGKGKEFGENGRTVLYKGDFVNGKRDGDGMEYKNGEIIYEGKWSKGKRDEQERKRKEEEEEEEERRRIEEEARKAKQKLTISTSSDLRGMDAYVVNVVILSNCCNDIGSLNWNNCKMLQSIEIGNECFEKVDNFTIDGINNLKSIKIGESSFTKEKNYWGDNGSRSFHILNCDKLESIEIGHHSFSDYSCEFELKNLPSLSSIKIGEIESESWNFYYSSFVVKGMIIIDI